LSNDQEKEGSTSARATVVEGELYVNDQRDQCHCIGCARHNFRLKVNNEIR
jgi:hypothetical protein